MTIIDPKAPQWALNFANSIRETINRITNPISPTRLVVYDTIADLPPADRYFSSILYLREDNTLRVSDGTAWVVV